MNKNIAKLGYYSSLVAFLAAGGYCIVQILQVIDVIHYPLDSILILGFSQCIAPPFLLAILALHYRAPNERKIWSHAAIIFAVMYVTYVTLNYAVQLGAVLPYANPNPVLDQTPHSLFWTVDALGYICMGISTFFASFVFSTTESEKWVKWFFVANGFVVPLISIVYFYPHYSTALLLLGIPWSITAPGSMLLLAIFFMKQSQKQGWNAS